MTRKTRWEVEKKVLEKILKLEEKVKEDEREMFMRAQIDKLAVASHQSLYMPNTTKPIVFEIFRERH